MKRIAPAMFTVSLIISGLIWAQESVRTSEQAELGESVDPD